jgi:hypothetical protein
MMMMMMMIIMMIAMLLAADGVLPASAAHLFAPINPLIVHRLRSMPVRHVCPPAAPQFTLPPSCSSIYPRLM